jgi:hypothetical protein
MCPSRERVCHSNSLAGQIVMLARPRGAWKVMQLK